MQHGLFPGRIRQDTILKRHPSSRFLMVYTLGRIALQFSKAHIRGQDCSLADLLEACPNRWSEGNGNVFDRTLSNSDILISWKIFEPGIELFIIFHLENDLFSEATKRKQGPIITHTFVKQPVPVRCAGM
jgi:hypothetical protein